MKLFYQYMAIFLNFSLTLTHLHSLQVGNCDSNSRLVVNEAPKEDPYHIFFVCPAYAVPRQTLTQDLNRILSVDIVQNKKKVEIILLYGSEILDHHTNLILFTTLPDFIYSSGRFS